MTTISFIADTLMEIIREEYPVWFRDEEWEDRSKNVWGILIEIDEILMYADYVKSRTHKTAAKALVELAVHPLLMLLDESTPHEHAEARRCIGYAFRYIRDFIGFERYLELWEMHKRGEKLEATC